MEKVILDMDPGIDDALALLLAISSPEIAVQGVTTVAGNTTVEKTGLNARRVLEYVGRGEIPVYYGSSSPMTRPLTTAEHVHGLDGLGEAKIPMPRQLPSLGGIQFIAETVANNPGEVTLIATGPLTNVALAFILYSRTPRLVKRLVIMGGAYHLTPYGRGNVTPLSEFNIYTDPEAANIVFNSSVPLTCVGLDISTNPSVKINRKRYEAIRGLTGKKAELASRIMKYQLERWGEVEVHDVLAVAAALRPEIFQTVEMRVQVLTHSDASRGATVAVKPREGEKNNASICTSVEGEKFFELLLSRLSEPG
ncbi:Pyrimidine-specific ribonucleoside hydrolase RihA [Candidatus Calditenuaceae archaeon HR02]|nr:Pyrimidine-specific ribonucleoside hydrolase RihA [Candidatus Calditenuaceae archaeon HR02]